MTSISTVSSVSRRALLSAAALLPTLFGTRVLISAPARADDLPTRGKSSALME